MTVAVDLSKLPAPIVVEQLSAETIRADMLAYLQSIYPDFTALVPSDPAYKILEVAAYRETLLRQRVNAATLATMLAYAAGSDLDQIGARFDVLRLLLDAGNPSAIPPVPATYESDAAFRLRIQYSFEGFSVAGPKGAYYFHAVSAHADVLDVGIQSPNPKEVLVTVLSRVGTGVPATPVLDAVEAALNDDYVRPLTDLVTVQAAAIVSYTIAATLTLRSDADSALVLAAANANATALTQDNKRVGRDIPVSAFYAALHVEGVASVTLTTPASGVTVSDVQAPHCTGITLVAA